MKKLLAIVIAAGGLAIPASAFGATASTQTCSTSKVAETHLVKVKEKVHEHGKLVTKTVEKREDVKVKEHVKEKVRVKVDGKEKTETKVVTKLVVKYRSVTTCTASTLAATAPATSTASTTPTPTTNTTAGPVVALAASIDPSYVQSSTNPYEVTWSYSASAQETSDGITQDDPSLPDGVLEFFSDGSLTQSSDVGGSVTSDTTTVTYTSWGDQSVDVVYDSGTSSGTTGTEGFDIEPPALDPTTVQDDWPTDAPTVSATISQDLSSDDVTLTDGNFEGANSVTLTDDYGNACVATVSGPTAECTMATTGVPNSFPLAFTVGYPGGTTTTQDETVAPYGVDQSQEVTTEWPADSYTVSSPSLILPTTTTASVAGGPTYQGCFGGGWNYDMTLATSTTLPDGMVLSNSEDNDYPDTVTSVTFNPSNSFGGNSDSWVGTPENIGVLLVEPDTDYVVTLTVSYPGTVSTGSSSATIPVAIDTGACS